MAFSSARRVAPSARPLRAQEEQITQSVLKDLQAYYSSNPKDADALLTVGESKSTCASAPELAAYTMAVNQLMNLDEVLNK